MTRPGVLSSNRRQIFREVLKVTQPGKGKIWLLLHTPQICGGSSHRSAQGTVPNLCPATNP